MAASTATDNQDQQHEDSSRMTIVDIPKTTPQRHHQQEQQQQQQQTLASAKTLHTLLGIAEHQHVELSQIALIYRAEGNANLVLALPQFKKVLRLPKMLPTTSSNTTSTTQQQQQHQSTSVPALNQNAEVGNDELTMTEFVAYIEIIRSLLGNEFVFETDIVHIPRAQDRLWINEHIKKDRPAHRLDKEFCGEFGLLLPDATRLPITFDILLSNLQSKLIGDTYAVEIKPKQGWLLPSDINDLFDIKPTTKTMARTTTTTATSSGTAAKVARLDNRCRFCAMQFLKLQQRKIDKRSSYCPLDLFSGVSSQMLAALDALFECPQNNLRIFQKGVQIYGDQNSISFEELVNTHFRGEKLQLIKDLVVKCLLTDYSGGAVAKAEAVEIVKAVAGQPHLNIERTAGKTSVVVEMEAATEASAHRRKTHPRAIGAKGQVTATVTAPTIVPATQAQITEVEMLCLPKNSVLQKILHLQLLAKRNLREMYAAGYAKKSKKCYKVLNSLLTKRVDGSELQCLSAFEQYLLGATALDCSILLAFQEVSLNCRLPSYPATHLIELPQYTKQFLTKITLVDLDPKPDSHFHKYVKQTKEAYNCCQEN